jgi:hypothetical protein
MTSAITSQQHHPVISTNGVGRSANRLGGLRTFAMAPVAGTGFLGLPALSATNPEPVQAFGLTTLWYGYPP